MRKKMFIEERRRDQKDSTKGKDLTYNSTVTYVTRLKRVVCFIPV